jgi:hypothetical protein
MTTVEKQELTDVIEKLYPDYTVDSFDLGHEVSESNTFILQNIRLTGKHMLSDDGVMDGQPISQLLATLIIKL